MPNKAHWAIINIVLSAKHYSEVSSSGKSHKMQEREHVAPDILKTQTSVDNRRVMHRQHVTGTKTASCDKMHQ